jgi:hypothetical protein
MAKDTRVTLKLERALWTRVEELIRTHPEWGIISVPDFVRRSIDTEIHRRMEAGSNRVLNFTFSPDSEDNRRRIP